MGLAEQEAKVDGAVGEEEEEEEEEEGANVLLSRQHGPPSTVM
jgi:hypothetical protein